IHVESIYSRSGAVFLSATQGSILDALGSDGEKIRANHVSLSAGGTIGTATDALEIVVTGAYGGDATDDDTTGTVTATAVGDIAISAVERNLNVRRIASASGDVFLRAELGSILDAEYNPGGIQGGADVIGNSIDLYAR